MGWRDYPAAPGAGTVLCELAAIPDGEGREFVFGNSVSGVRVLIVRRGDRAWGYVNRCPHNYIPLNDMPDRFVSFDHEWIVCSTHGAVFRYEDGFCEDGPCQGRNLEALPILVENAAIVVAD